MRRDVRWRWAEPDLKRCIFPLARRIGWCEFSARLFLRKPCSWRAEVAYWNHLDTDMLRWRLEITDTDTYLRKVFEMRLATEPAASAIAARFADASDRARIMRAFDAMVATGSDNLLWVEADLEFHKAIYLATHNEFFWPIGQLFNLGRSARYSPSQRKDRNERARWRSTEI